MAIAKLPIEKFAAALLIAAAVGCAPAPRIAFPTGAVVPSQEAAAIWQTTTAACRAATNYSAEIVIDGRVGAEKLRRVTLQGAMTRDGRIRLIAVAPIGGPIFVLAGRAERATLTLPRDHRVLTAPVADIVNALIGLKFAPADWVDVLSGCVAGTDHLRQGSGGPPKPSAEAEVPAYVPTGGQLGADLVMTLADGARALLRKTGADWRVLAGERSDAVIEYRKYLGTWPSLASINSAASAAVTLSINLEIGQIFVNSELADKTFTLDVPADFTPMTLAELRAIGPLGERDAGTEVPAYVPVGRNFSSGAR